MVKKRQSQVSFDLFNRQYNFIANKEEQNLSKI